MAQQCLANRKASGLEMARQGVYSNNFSVAFSQLLEKSGVSCYQISRFAHLDQAYLSRLKNGTKQNPSPETIVKISLALTRFSDKITVHDIQRLFSSVGRSLNLTDDY
jgi:transcriptional regulator with XRE-family HTH domain